MLSSIQGPVLPRLGDGYVLSNMNLRRYYYAHLIFQGELVWAMLCFFQRTLSGRGASRCRRKSCWTGRSHYHYHHHHCHHNHYQTGLFSENNPCSEDPEYSFRACVSIWVARKAGCHLDWFRSSSSYVAIATLAVLVLFGRALKPLHFNANNALPQRNMSENYPPWTTKHNGNKNIHRRTSTKNNVQSTTEEQHSLQSQGGDRKVQWRSHRCAPSNLFLYSYKVSFLNWSTR